MAGVPIFHGLLSKPISLWEGAPHWLNEFITTGKIVTMDSAGFCVTAGILAMHDHGVFGKAFIKKRG